MSEAPTRFADRVQDSETTQTEEQEAASEKESVDTCPECGGIPEFGTDTVESCCSTHQVAAVSCTDCDARLFESQPM